VADRALCITWGEVVRGREERALENFNDVVGLYGRMQQEGRIERFDVTLLMPNGKLGGTMQLQGTLDQIVAVKEDAEFQLLIAAATLIVDDLSLVDGYVNEGIASQMAMYQDAIAKLAQPASTTGGVS
jgi:hypothetical protein